MIKSTHMKNMLVVSGALAASVCFAAAPTDVYLLIGQSNMAGRGDVSVEKIDNSRLLKWGDAGGWVEATEPIYRDGETAGAGPGMSFGRMMADADPKATVGLVGAAIGGTLLREWMPGETFYTNAVARCKAALAAGGRLRGILWHQGCADSVKQGNAESYADRLAILVSALRKEFGEVPFVAGEIGQFLDDYVWTGPDGRQVRYGSWRTVNAQLHEAAKKIPNMRVVSSEGAVHKGDILHFDTHSQRMMGRRFAAAMQELLDGGTVRAAWTREVVSCPVGSLLAGYGPHDVSVAKADDLYLNALAVDDGTAKVAIFSFDLLGLDAATVKALRADAAKALGVTVTNVLFTCTHTHGGPHSRVFNHKEVFADLDHVYIAKLREAVRTVSARFADEKLWRRVKVGYHSASVDENRNRRHTTADNRATFCPLRRHLYKLGTGIADKELGTLAFLDPETDDPRYVVGNYAAHTLDSHAPGLGGYRITADFPGYFRRYLRSETAAEAMFVQGAAGDLVSKGDEQGLAAAQRTGETLARAAIESVIDIQRDQRRFVMASPKVGGVIRTFTTPLRKQWAKKLKLDVETLEVQCIAIGDVAFVGVPGETVNELGLEIKWHSPFKRTFVAYCSTGYFGYIAPPNFVAAGGYEGKHQRFAGRDVLKLVETSRDGLFDLYAALHPEASEGGEEYPDCVELPLVAE